MGRSRKKVEKLEFPVKSSTSKKRKLLKVKENTISFDTWFYIKVRNNQVRSEQKHEIRVFFKNKGLRSQEDIDLYEEIFKLY